MTITVEFSDGTTFEGRTDEPVMVLAARWMLEHAEKTVDDIVAIRRA